MLQYGKRIPQYEADGSHVTLKIFDGAFDHSMARLIAEWQSKGKDIGLDGLIILTFLKDNSLINSTEAAKMLQMSREEAISVLENLCHPTRGIIERKGHTRSATYYLTKSIAKDLIGKVAYSSIKGIDHARYKELALLYVQDHGSITNNECRQLLRLGDSPSAQVEASRYLKQWSGPNGFLKSSGNGRATKYMLRES
jgi:ATP-dependent DNA helicase RecG